MRLHAPFRGRTLMSSVLDLASAADGLFVLETRDGDAFLGQLIFAEGEVVIHNGFVGRPHVIPQEDVVSIQPAAHHPDVFIPRQRHRE
jgi:hypothetical protein